MVVGTELGVPPPCSSAHWPIVVGLDLRPTFGVDSERFRTPTQSINPTAFALRGGNEASVARFESLVTKRWDEHLIP